MGWRKLFQPTKAVSSREVCCLPYLRKIATKILFHPFTVWTSSSTLSHWGHQPEDSLLRSGGPVLFRKRPTARGVKSCAWDRLDVSEFRLNPPNSVSMILAVYIHSWERSMSLQFSLGPISKTEVQESQNNGKHAFIPIQNQSLQEKPANFHPRVKKNIFFPQHVFRPALAPWSPLSAKVACHLSSPPCWGAQRWLAKTLVGLFKKVFPYHIETIATTQDRHHPTIPESPCNPWGLEHFECLKQ